MAAGLEARAEASPAALPPLEKAPSKAPGEDVEDPSTRDGMYRCNDNLEELLRLAKGYLRSGRSPGELRMRDYFERFEAEASAKTDPARCRPLEDETPLDWVADPLPPVVAPVPEDLSGEALLARLQRDIRKIERSTAELKEECQCVNQHLANKTLERCRAQEDLVAAEAKVQKAQRSIRETKDLFKRQEREIRELRAALAAPRQQPRAGEGAAAAAGAAAGIPASARRHEADSHQHQSGAATDRPSTRGGSARRAESTPARPPMTPRSPQELKGALLDGEDPEGLSRGSTAAVWGHLRSENEKLASVIDAVGELSRQLHGGAAGAGTAASAGAGGVAGEEAPHAGATSPKGDARTFIELTTFIQPPKSKTYTSVLANKPKNYKVYM